MHKKHIVSLSPTDRLRLRRMLGGGLVGARAITRARILLKADQGHEGPAWPDQRIAAALDVSRATIGRVRRRFAEAGLDAALARQRPRSRPPRKIDGAHEARLVVLACSAPPAGRAR